MGDNPAKILNPVSYSIYSVRCPIHRDVEIGEWAGELEDIVHQGFYCGKCGKTKRFNRENFEKYLQLEYFPIKVI